MMIAMTDPFASTISHEIKISALQLLPLTTIIGFQKWKQNSW
jgi:hypothetical protein